MLRKPVELSLQTFEVLWERLNLGDVHPTLVRGALWYSLDERRQLAADADRELAECGLLRGGRLDDDFVETLHVLQRPRVDYYSWVKSGRGERTVRAAASGRDAVTVVATGQKLYLAACSADSLAQEFTALLPDAPAARLASLTCSDTDLKAIKGGAIPNTTSPSIRDAKQVLRWLNAQHTHFGRLYVAIRDSRGRRRRNEDPPGWADTDQGRILFGVDGSGWVSLSGAGPQEIASKVQRLAYDLRNRG
ncbi:ESX secretion-associated protein EspG [Amycolatopsis saalfeldensis]|uniref:EspG family protein n=1 Tax=Amycolatopsis saalfeldensis TaxID=394193 RepID=A0A1H8QQU7_9PSEU|nr:ESX secretion-associated protein EspG [Amycolatopsis saalfeldensis]SEO56562.1 EspG family protein [Amycolatopsis saalfeldensis]